MPGQRFHVYILASRTRRLYVGITRELSRRLHQYRAGRLPGFTHRYGVTRLVYAEEFDDVRQAIAREKQLKRWPRWRKERLIEVANCAWSELDGGWRTAEDRTGARDGESDPDTRLACGEAPAG